MTECCLTIDVASVSLLRPHDMLLHAQAWQAARSTDNGPHVRGCVIRLPATSTLTQGGSTNAYTWIVVALQGQWR